MHNAFMADIIAALATVLIGLIPIAVIWFVVVGRKRLPKFSKRTRLTISAVLWWLAFAFVFAFGGDIWGGISDYSESVFFFVLTVPPVLAGLVFANYRWIRAS